MTINDLLKGFTLSRAFSAAIALTPVAYGCGSTTNNYYGNDGGGNSGNGGDPWYDGLCDDYKTTCLADIPPSNQGRADNIMRECNLACYGILDDGKTVSQNDDFRSRDGCATFRCEMESGDCGESTEHTLPKYQAEVRACMHQYGFTPTFDNHTQ